MSTINARSPERRRRIPRLLILVGGLALGMCGVSRVALSQGEPTGSRSSSRHALSPNSEEEGMGAIDAPRLRKLESEITTVSKKLDDIASTQQTILQKFDAIMEELRIIKVRATLSRGG